jgi:hypothetical protein
VPAQAARVRRNPQGTVQVAKNSMRTM